MAENEAREIARLRDEVAALRDEIKNLKVARAVPQASPPASSGLSRRALLTGVPAVVAAAGVGALASPARADTPTPLLEGPNFLDTDTWFTLENGATWSINCEHIAMGDGGNVSVHFADQDTPQLSVVGGLFGGDPAGPHGNDAVEATTYGEGVGLDVSTDSGPVLKGLNSDKTTKTDSAAITNVGLGRGLLVSSTNTKNAMGASTGINHGTGAGVWGTSSSGDGVVGVSTHGRGGRFRGHDAAINLAPSTAATHPTTGSVGDVFVDAKARLWFCRKSATSTAHAAWVQVV